MNLAGQSLKFENGQWVAGECPFLMFCPSGWQEESPFTPVLCPLDSVISGGVDRRETQRLRKRNQQLEEENNLLRLKVDILLDMVRTGSEVTPGFPQLISPGPTCQLLPLDVHTNTKANLATKARAGM